MLGYFRRKDKATAGVIGHDGMGRTR